MFPIALRKILKLTFLSNLHRVDKILQKAERKFKIFKGLIEAACEISILITTLFKENVEISFEETNENVDSRCLLGIYHNNDIYKLDAKHSIIPTFL